MDATASPAEGGNPGRWGSLKRGRDTCATPGVEKGGSVGVPPIGMWASYPDTIPILTQTRNATAGSLPI